MANSDFAFLQPTSPVNPPEEEDRNYSGLPIFQAADLHSVANSGMSWTNPAAWNEKLGNVGKFIAVSALSGINSFYNTGAAIGSFFDPGIQERDTATWITSLDTNLGEYYAANTEAADLTGFVLGALVPGLGGIKIFNAGQLALKTARTGEIGGTLGRALGLLTPKTDIYLKEAIKDITASTTSLQLLNVNTTKAIAGGLWQNVMEAAAFETMVQATMFRSPILQEQSASDVVKNILIGGAFGGAVAGVFGAAKLRGALKEAVTKEEVPRRPFQELPQFHSATPSANKIITTSADLEMAAVPVAIRNADGTEIVNNFATTKNLYDAKITSGLNTIRTEINTLAKGDEELGNIFANLVSPAKKDGQLVPGFSQQTFDSFSGALKIARADEITKLENDYAKALAKGETPEREISSRFVKLFGDDAGQTFDEAPKILSFGDKYSGAKSIKQAIRTDFKFSSDFEAGTNRWSVVGLRGAKAHTEAEARYIWAAKESGMLKEVPVGAVVDAYDLPVLQRAFSDGQFALKIVSGEGPTLAVREISTKQELYDLIKASKQETVNHYLGSFTFKNGKPRKEGKIPREDASTAIAKIADVRENYIAGNPSGVEIDDLFATASAQRKYNAQLAERGIPSTAAETQTPIQFLPKYGKVVYDVAQDVKSVNGNVLDALTHYSIQEKLYQENANRAVSKVLGQWAEQLPNIPKEKLVTATRNETSAGLFSSDSSAYGTVSSTMSFVGGITRAVKQEFRKNISDTMQDALYKVGQKPEAAFEFEALNQRITRSGKQFVLRESDDGTMVLVDKNAIKRTKDGEEIPWEDLEDGVNAFNITQPETAALIREHIQTTGSRTQNFREINASRGKSDVKDPEVFRPIRPDLKQYPHFAFVKDPRVTGTGHTTMIHAASEKELAALVDRVPPEYRVVYKKDTEEYFMARSEYEYARTLNENYIDTDLANKGVFSNFFPKSDPGKIVDDVLQQHYRESDTLVYESVRLRYEPEFALLEDLGEQYSKVETSRFASKAAMIEASSRNPYFNQIKTALDISKINEHPIIYSANKLLDDAFSRASRAVSATWESATSTKDLEKINKLLDEQGLKPAYYDSALQGLANHTAPKGELTKFIRGANAILSRFTLGLDPLNALNNAIGSNILRGTELTHITRAIREGNSALAGDLAALTKIPLPGLEREAITAPTKLVSQAIRNFFKDDGKLLRKYKDMQLIKDRAEQLKMVFDDFTLKGTETVSELNTRLQTGFARAKSLTSTGLDKLEAASGNKLAEEFNRFISANVMDQITSVAIKHGVMDEATARTYINTFVNRIEGNIVASQRPLVFQGPIGQAISLFQSYQFNLIQQLLRYTAEGKAKDLAMLAGLQSTLYGYQSLPGFQAINVHLIGQLSGNTEHRDAYDAVYGIAGRTAGDFILYGLPSKLLDTNIYSRGDINPRQLTILPTTLQETPIVAGWGKFFQNIYATTKQIAGGGAVWETFLQGVEHNGISRPLAGMAQTLQALDNNGVAYSTSSKGSILYQNDLMSLATLTRLAGGRPLDEALVNDAMFRVKSYEAARRGDMQSLAEKVKSTLIQGNTPSPEQINQFTEEYAKLGGKQKGFNRWMVDLYKSANVSQAEQMQSTLSNPYAYKVQLLMGGEE